MKKLLLITAVAVFGFTSVNSQEVHFGAKAGLNLASITGEDTGELDGRTSFHVGAVAEIAISDVFSVQPELLYSAQGAKYEDSYSEMGYSEEIEATIKYDYITLPIIAKYYVAEGFSIEAGPQVGFLMTAEADYDAKVSYEGVSESESGTEDFKDDTSGIDFGLNFGFGYKMESGLNFAARYNVGLSNINDFEGSDDYKQQNSVIQVSVGYFFN